jgi:plastocyanin
MRTSLKRRQVVPAAFAFTVAFVLAIAVLAPGAQRVAAQDPVTVDIVDFAFDPATMTIEAGTTVTWVNQGAAPHTATGDNGEFDTGQLDSGQSASITFDTPGTYAYHCEIHPNMTATIVVVEAGDGTTDLPTTGIGASPGGTGSRDLAALATLAGLLFVLGLATIRNRVA